MAQATPSSSSNGVASAASSTKSVGLAYLFWLIGGWCGLHLFYVRRDYHWMAYMCSFGGFGVWWLIDGCRMTSYVDQCNQSHAWKEIMKTTIRVQARPNLPILRSLAMVLMYSLFSRLFAATLDWAEGDSKASYQAFAEDGLPPPAPVPMWIRAISVIGHPVCALAGGVLGIILMGAAAEDRELVANGWKRIAMMSTGLTVICAVTPIDWNLISWLPPALIAVYHRHTQWRSDLFQMAEPPASATESTQTTPAATSPSSKDNKITTPAPIPTTNADGTPLTKAQKKAAAAAAAAANTEAALKERKEAMRAASGSAPAAAPAAATLVKRRTVVYRRRHWCVRAFQLSLVWFGFSSLCMNYILNRWTITTDVGDVRVIEAIQRMRRSKAYQEFWQLLGREWENAQQRGWQSSWENMKSQFDLGGEEEAYNTLELKCAPDDCTSSDYRRARNALALKYHPDKNHDDPEAAAAKFRAIQSAYERLTAKLEKKQQQQEASSASSPADSAQHQQQQRAHQEEHRQQQQTQQQQRPQRHTGHHRSKGRA